MKKFLSLALSLLLCFSMTLCAFAAPAPTESATGGEMVLETEVPTNHKITITYNDGGYVLAEGTLLASGNTITVVRFDSLRLDVIENLDTHLEKVTVNGQDVTDQVVNGQLTLERIHTDMDVVFSFQNCKDVEPPHVDPCHHMLMNGKIYIGEAIFKNAQLDIDFGNIKAQADKEGNYRVDDIKDGCHKAVISDEKGNVKGEEVFCITVDASVTEPMVERLPNGTQLVRVPEGTKEFKMDFIVNEDGSITIRPSIEIPGDNPPLIKTGGAEYNTPHFYANIFLTSFAVFSLFLLFLALAKKKDEDEEEQAIRS